MNSKLIYILSASSVLLLATACKVPRVATSDLVAMPGQYAANMQAETDTTTIADLSWRQFITDTTLQRLIQDGIDYNFDLQLALKRLSASQERLKQAKLLQLPAINAGVTAQTSHPSQNSLTGISLNSFLGQKHIEDYNAAFSLSWEADIWGKIRLRKDAALATYLQTYEAQKAVQTQVVAAIAQGYYNLLMLDEQLSVARNNLQLNDTTVVFTRLQWDAGIVTSLAVQQAEAQQQSVALLIPQLEMNIAVQEHALSLLTGKMPDRVYRNSKLAELSVLDNYAIGVPAGLLSRRPDVRAQEFVLRTANAQLGVAQREMYPSLTITAAGGLNSFKASNWFEIPASLFGNVLGGLTQPVFQRGALRMNLALAKNQREQAVISFRQSVMNAVAEVADALVQYDRLKQQSDIATNQVNTLKGAVHNARLLYQGGMANYLEVMTVQSNALQAELNLAQIRRQQLNNTVNLYRALGGGWK